MVRYLSTIIVFAFLTLAIPSWCHSADHPSFRKDAPEEKGSYAVKFENLRPTSPKKYRNLRNPLIRDEKNLLAGERLYDINCSPCHGGNLDGNGPEASGFFPPPANLISLVSVIKPPESYLFWRVKEGGPALPMAWRPWDSAMPVWKGELEDREIWQIILYIYEAAGEIPHN